ncbi:MAG: phosphoribosylformylglycinamidine cyclo-ligase [Deltaproteobacteria bacterium]|uniref:Phosphoribosylformylglycinamidine cyclo-ligase n=1 Tax=Candidatus Zymogenus saltonus TaxID=2844893 RepID=A0A9D8KAT1_9DELT|nr:phosphoribosylformylglycinamidine cyclo-ligase [Candidatus Zymogenus saltonus]
MGITYKDSGVDINKANLFVKKIKEDIDSTRTEGVMGEIGGFGGFFRPDIAGMKDPVLVSSTDGVGTKLIIAQMMGIHRTVGIDLVAMVANDIIVTGALPIFFLDYIATGSIDDGVLADVISGIAKGCIDAECALIGGETAEMPGFYPEGKYDLCGFSVGLAERDSVIDGSKIEAGDAIVGVTSSGLHSNGFSLVRKIVFDTLKMKLDNHVEELKKSIGEELLTPTRIYVKMAKSLFLGEVKIHAISHITGGGLVDNIERLLPEGLSAVIDTKSWDVPPIFRFIKEAGKIEELEMMRTFNNGIGLALIVPSDEVDKAVSILKKSGESPSVIGGIERKKGEAKEGGRVLFR